MNMCFNNLAELFSLIFSSLPYRQTLFSIDLRERSLNRPSYNWIELWKNGPNADVATISRETPLRNIEREKRAERMIQREACRKRGRTSEGNVEGFGIEAGEKNVRGGSEG